MWEENRDFWSPILKERGFEKIGDVQYELHVQLWWHPRDRVKVLIYVTDTAILLRATKAYSMKSISEEGESYARDLNSLQEYLESHLPEVCIVFHYVRDITANLAFKRMKEKRLGRDTEESHEHLTDREAQVRLLREEFAAKRESLHQTGELLKLDSGGSSLVQSYLKRRSGEIKRELEEIGRRGKELESSAASTRYLLSEYLKKGSAACFMINFSSNLHKSSGPEEFQDCLYQVVKEVIDLDRYQVRQKLNGGKLRIFVEEVESPDLSWQIQWAGGVLNPRQLDRLGSEFEDLGKRASEFLMVTPAQDVKFEGAVKDEKKLLSAWVVRNFLKRLDKLPRPGDVHEKGILRGDMPIWVGRLIKEDLVTSEPAILSLGMIESIYISGCTGSGKTFCARALIEGAAVYEEINILVLDPRNQSVGLLLAEDREDILAHYPEFGLDPTQARGFEFRYYGPGIAAGEPLPAALAELGRGRAIVSFKDVPDRERCASSAAILEQVFADHTREESGGLRTLVLIMEAQLLTKKKVADDAKGAAEGAERAVERVLREGRKYGLRAILESQTIKDFGYGSASIRQNTNTKIFMRNSDREVDYAADFIGDGRQIIRLKTGTAICYNAQWGALKFKVRPPFSKVWELSAADTRRLVNGPVARSGPSFSPDGLRLLEIARRHHGETGSPINLSEAANKLGITSKRRMQELVRELERAALVRTTRLNKKGKPRVIIPMSGPDPD